MNNIQGGRWDELLRRLFPVKEKTIAPAVSPEVMPVIVVQPHEPEMYFLKREYIAAGEASIAAVGGQIPFVEFSMPEASPSVIVLEWQMFLDTNFSANIVYGWAASHLGGVAVATGYRDSRKSQTVAVAQTIPTLFAGTRVGAPVIQEFMRLPNTPGGSSARELENTQPIVMGPDSTLVIYGDTAGSAWSFSATWRERSIEESERGLG